MRKDRRVIGTRSQLVVADGNSVLGSLLYVVWLKAQKASAIHRHWNGRRSALQYTVIEFSKIGGAVVFSHSCRF